MNDINIRFRLRDAEKEKASLTQKVEEGAVRLDELTNERDKLQRRYHCFKCTLLLVFSIIYIHMLTCFFDDPYLIIYIMACQCPQLSLTKRISSCLTAVSRCHHLLDG